MTLDEIKALIEAVGRSDLAEVEIEKDGWTLRLRRGPRSAPDGGAPAATPSFAPRSPSVPSGHAAKADPAIRAPLGGTVHLTPAPGARPFVEAGETIEAGALLCTVEAMKMFNEIRAEKPGIVAGILVASGEEVEAGQILLRIE